MGWRGGEWVEGVACEDAPCCGCCGTNLYGTNEGADSGPEFCDICMSYHSGPCPDDFYEEEEDEDGPFD